jgi:YVTN family beta-propeller protein
MSRLTLISGSPCVALLLSSASLLATAARPACAQALESPADAPAPPPVRAYVLDSESNALSVLDPAEAKVLASLPLEGEPAGLLRTKDGSRVFLFDFGDRKLSLRFGWHPKTQSTLTVVDPVEAKVVSRTQVGWNLARILPTADGTRLTAICEGYQSQKPEETLPREVVSLDSATGEVKGRLAIERPFDVSLLTSDSDVAVLYSAPVTRKNAPTEPGELRLVDVKGPSLLATLKVEGSPSEAIYAPGRRYVYLLERGKRDKKPEKTVRARLQVFSVEEKAHVGNLDVGVEARDTALDEPGGALYVLSDGQPSPENKKPRGALHVVKGAELAASVPIGPMPLFVRHAEDRERIYVVSARDLTIVDPVAWSAVGELPLEEASGGLGEVAVGYPMTAPNHSPANLSVTPDGRRGFVLYNTASKLLVLDLENHKKIEDVATGRGGKKFAKFLGAAALSALATAGSSMTYVPTTPSYMLLVSTDLAMRPDGKFVYANNSQSNDVTIVDTETAAVLDKVPTGGKRLMTFHGKKTLGVIDDTSLHLIDMESNKKTGEVEFASRLSRVTLTPDGTRALALTDGAVHVLDGVTGKALARVEGFKKPTQLLFVGGEATQPTAE